MSTPRPDDETVQAQVWLAQEQGLEGNQWITRHPGTTYEQGVHNALRWVLDQSQPKPVEAR